MESEKKPARPCSTCTARTRIGQMPSCVFIAIHCVKRLIIIIPALSTSPVIYKWRHKKNKIMAKEQLNIIDYMVSCVGAFALRFAMTNQLAYSYLNKYQGLSFLYECYNVEHTQSIEDAVEDITRICLRHGGNIK